MLQGAADFAPYLENACHIVTMVVIVYLVVGSRLRCQAMEQLAKCWCVGVGNALRQVEGKASLPKWCWIQSSTSQMKQRRSGVCAQERGVAARHDLQLH